MFDIEIIYIDYVKCLGFYFGVLEFWLILLEEYDLILKKFVLGLEMFFWVGKVLKMF